MPLPRKAGVLLLSTNNMICSSTVNGKNRQAINILIRSTRRMKKKLSEVADANAADVDAAVKAARNAYEKVWKKMPAKERAKYVFRIARMVQEKGKRAGRH
jgi:acyl-CoA reductase-like NAD-dependent aldehyde dehydrogenase